MCVNGGMVTAPGFSSSSKTCVVVLFFCIVVYSLSVAYTFQFKHEDTMVQEVIPGQSTKKHANILRSRLFLQNMEAN